MSYTKVKLFTFFLAMTGLLASCSYEKSSVTGWDYNNPAYGGFQKVPYEEQETGPGLILIEGGTFTMGRVEQETPQKKYHGQIQEFYLRFETTYRRP